MITTVAVHGYRSLRELVMSLDDITLATGPNGSGKSSVYRALRLLPDTARGDLIAALASEGGLQQALWAGPEQAGPAVRRGEHP